MKRPWTSLEHHVWKKLKEFSLETHDNFILAISGGLDSMVLLEVLVNLKPQANFKVAYYHHGPSNFKSQEEFRDRAYEVVQQRVQSFNKKNVIFVGGRSSNELLSEDKMRSARWSFLRGLVHSNEVVVTAHHLDDRLETMLLKMIRGTSIDGLFSFKIWNHEILRPFLETTKQDLLVYAQTAELYWVEDPSNSEDHYLRNWVREKWLKDLDEKLPAGSKNLSKSLLRINEFVGEVKGEGQSLELELGLNTDATGLNRQWFVSLSRENQLRSLALFLKKHQMYNFTSGQLKEIQKRLDKNQKDIKFELLGRKWVINASQIMLQ